MIPLDEEKIVVDSWKDIVIRFNGDPYRGRSRSVPSQKGYKSAKYWTLEIRGTERRSRRMPTNASSNSGGGIKGGGRTYRFPREPHPRGLRAA